MKIKANGNSIFVLKLKPHIASMGMQQKSALKHHHSAFCVITKAHFTATLVQKEME